MTIDYPDGIMRQAQQRKYGAGADVTKYPLDLGSGELHSFINFRVVDKTPVSHIAEPGGAKSGNQVLKSVALYVPENVGVAQQANYEEAAGAAVTAAKGAVKAGGGLSGFGSALLDAGSMGGNQIMRSIADMAVQNGAEIAQQVFTGKASNANRAQLFQGISFRQFTFEYKFVAKSQEESSAIQNITQVFRENMLPDFEGPLNRFYTLPNVFEIEYFLYGQNGRAKSLHSFKPSVLTSCELSYGADGQFGMFIDGAPTNVQMNLTFLEIEQVVKSDVAGGY